MAFRRTSDYLTKEWLELRDSIVVRDGHRCRNCGTHEKLEVHHWLPLPEFQDDVDQLGYATNEQPLIVHESGLVTLCDECHAAMTSVREKNAVLRNPKLQRLGRRTEQELFNIFQLWALTGENLPFKARKADWNPKVEQYYVVERIEISKWPYGFAWGRYCREGSLGETQKIKGAGTYNWIAVQASTTARLD